MLLSQIVLLLSLVLLPTATLALTIEEGLKIVSESGRDVKIARSAELSAQGSVSLARSTWLPQVDVYGRETWLRHQPEAKTPSGSFPMSQDRFVTYGIQAYQLLYDFGKTSSSVRAAEYALKAREIETDRAKNRSALEFIIAYFDLLEAEKLVNVTAGEVKQYETHKHDAEARYQAGVVTKNEVLQADVTLANSRQRFLNAENLRSLRTFRINSLLIRPLNEEIQVEEVQGKPSVDITLEEAWIIAEVESPEVRIIDAAIRSREENLSEIRSEYLPSFYISGGFEHGENKYMVHDENWSIIAGVTFNLLSGGASGAKLRIGKNELLKLKITRDTIADAVRLDVKSAYLNLQTSLLQIDVMKASVAQAEENLRLQRLRYQEGVGTATEVIDAVTLLTTAQSNSWSALYGFGRAEAGLLFAMGRDLTGMYGHEAGEQDETPVTR